MKNQTSSLDNSHFPVMLNEVIKISAPVNGGIFVDCTLGGGGYTSALLKFPNTKVIAIDRDKNAISIANKLREKFDFLVVDFHGEITSEKMAIGHIFDGSATFVVGTHTHVPTNDGRILNNGTAYLTDAGMCGDYNSVIGMNTQNSLNRFYKKNSEKHFPSEGEASLCGAIIEADPKNGLALKITQFIFGGQLQKSI